MVDGTGGDVTSLAQTVALEFKGTPHPEIAFVHLPFSGGVPKVTGQELATRLQGVYDQQQTGDFRLVPSQAYVGSPSPDQARPLSSYAAGPSELDNVVTQFRPVLSDPTHESRDLVESFLIFQVVYTSATDDSQRSINYVLTRSPSHRWNLMAHDNLGVLSGALGESEDTPVSAWLSFKGGIPLSEIVEGRDELYHMLQSTLLACSPRDGWTPSELRMYTNDDVGGGVFGEDFSEANDPDTNEPFYHRTLSAEDAGCYLRDLIDSDGVRAAFGRMPATYNGVHAVKFPKTSGEWDASVVDGHDGLELLDEVTGDGYGHFTSRFNPTIGSGSNTSATITNYARVSYSRSTGDVSQGDTHTFQSMDFVVMEAEDGTWYLATRELRSTDSGGGFGGALVDGGCSQRLYRASDQQTITRWIEANIPNYGAGTSVTVDSSNDTLRTTLETITR